MNSRIPLTPGLRLGPPRMYSSRDRTNPTGPKPGGSLAALGQRVSNLEAEQVPLDLTFGIELEFLLLGQKPMPSRHTRPDYVSEVMVYDALRQPVQATCATCGEPHTITLPVACPDDMDDVFCIDQWSVGHDSTVRLTQDEERALVKSCAAQSLVSDPCFHAGMELKSRVFTQGKNFPTTDSLTDTYHRHEITTDHEINLMLALLDHSFNGSKGSQGGRRNIRLAVNSSCGLHCHVGNGVFSRGFPLNTVKNILSLYVAHERSIDSIQSVHRIGGTTLAVQPLSTQPTFGEFRLPGPGVYNVPMSRALIASAYSALYYSRPNAASRGTASQYPFDCFETPEIKRSAFSFRPSDFINLIQSAPSLEDVRGIHRMDEHRGTLNLQHLQNFVPSGNAGVIGKVTVEFRQHHGTIEPVEVLAWIDFVTSLVRFAHDASPARMRRHLDNVLTSPATDVLDLMRETQCQLSTVRHYLYVLGRTPTGEDYATARRNTQRAGIASDPAARDSTRDVREMIALSCAATLAAPAVRDRIAMKFKLGGYGRFTPEYLAQYAPALSMKEQQRLTAGTVITSPPSTPPLSVYNDDGNRYDSETRSDATHNGDYEASDLALSPMEEPDCLPQTVFDSSSRARGASHRPPPAAPVEPVRSGSWDAGDDGCAPSSALLDRRGHALPTVDTARRHFRRVIE